ncbi:hypothetical protein ACFQY7_19030 [Actinomadura luteofluorescens]|uniref:hypothetical protein n=1 Tax=Actinomadura luteofluorescens TaxID=46163 RepID=UPI00362CFC07
MTAGTATAPVPPDTFNASDYLLRAASGPGGDRTALTGPGGDLSYAELAELAGSVAAAWSAGACAPRSGWCCSWPTARGWPPRSWARCGSAPSRSRCRRC